MSNRDHTDIDVEVEVDERAMPATAPVGDDAEVDRRAEVTEAIEVAGARPLEVPEADALDQALEVDFDDDHR